MNYLIVDDTPEHLKLLAQTLRSAEHQVTFARDLGIAWGWLERGDRFGLVVIDLALDRYIREFAEEHGVIKERLALQGLGDLPMSGQALGLRLWRHRKTLQQRYCYITHHRQIWLANLDAQQPEFGDGASKILDKVLIDKSSIWPKNVLDILEDARHTWEEQKWLD